MSKSLPLFVSAVGGAALVLGVAYGMTTRQYRDAEIATLERKVEQIEERQVAMDATASREDELSEKIAELEAALVTAEERADAAEASAAAAAEAIQVAAAPAPEEEPEPPVETVAVALGLGDADNGEALFRECYSCHMVGDGAFNRTGPHLNGIFGRRAAGLDGFKYSASLQRAGSDGVVWDFETLSAYVDNPKAFASGTRMSYRGMKDPEDRADLLAYLRIFSDDPSNIPEAAPTARATDHNIDPEILAIEGDPAYGEYLSSECLTCHRADGAADGIPSITLWPEEDFVVAMHAYKQKLRPHPVMQMMAGRLNNEEIASLAAYFAQLEQ